MTRNVVMALILGGLCLLLGRYPVAMAVHTQNINCLIQGYVAMAPATWTGESGSGTSGQCGNPNVWKNPDGTIVIVFRFDNNRGWNAAASAASAKKQAGRNKVNFSSCTVNHQRFWCGIYRSIVAGVATAQVEWDIVVKGRHYQIIGVVNEAGSIAQVQSREGAASAMLDSILIAGPQA